MQDLQWIGGMWFLVGLGLVAMFFVVGFLARIYRKAGPHEALIVYGFRGTRVVKGHGTLIFPMVESCRELSLELPDGELEAAMTTMIATTQNLCEAAGAAALACVLRYSERFSGKKVAIICSGGNVTVEQLQDVLSSPAGRPVA